MEKFNIKFSNFFFILLNISFFYINFTNGQVDIQIFKCCPSGFELRRVNPSDKNNPKFECNKFPENLTELTKFSGYKVIVDEYEHIPKCANEEFEIFEFNKDNVNLTLGSCVDLVNNTNYLALQCKKPGEYQPIEVLDLRKCCPFDHFYNTATRECIPNTFDNFSLEKIIGNFPMLLNIGSPICNIDNDVLVEYKSHLHNLTFDKTSIFIKTTNDQLLILNSNNMCIERTKTDNYESNIKWIVKVCQEKSVCSDIPCVRKCCKDGERMMKLPQEKRPVCVPYLNGINPIFYDIQYYYNYEKTPTKKDLEVFGTFESQTCPKYVLEPEEDDGDHHYLSHLDGSLHVVNIKEIVDNNNYCMEFYGNPEKLKTFVCFYDITAKFKYYAVGLTISCVFLMATIIVYSCLPKLLNLHGKTLLSHNISLLIAYGLLAYVQFETQEKIPFCRGIAFFIYFGCVASFSWLNIMCFDIWWAFGSSVRQSRGMRKSKELKRYLFYSIYAWGLPIVLTIITFCVDTFSNLPDKFKPNMGYKKCWFQDSNSPGHIIFFLIPVGIQICTNVILFILTTIHCNKIKNEIHRMQNTTDVKEKKKKSFLKNKAQFKMNVKLFIVMGVSWFLELLATAMDFIPELWYLTDAFNVLQGLLVCIIFVFKKPVLNAVKNKLGIKTTKSTLGSATTGTTNVTTSGSGSATCIDPYSVKYGKLTKNTSNSNLTTSTSTINISKRNE